MQDKLEEYFKKMHTHNITDHAIKTSIGGDGEIFCHIYPQYKDGDILDFKVVGNQLIPIIDVEIMR